jgi:surface-anchored protein
MITPAQALRAVWNRPAWLLFALWASAVAVSAHTHVEVVYREGELRLLYYDYNYGEYDPADIILDVGVAAASPIPNIAAFTNLLGEASATTWILPQIENADLLWLGVGNASLTATDFIGNQYLTLLEVEGPGHFVLYLNDSFGYPMLPVPLNSRDGVTTNDTLTLPLHSHLHCNWAFSAPGRYRVRLKVTGTLRSGNTPIASAPTDYFFAVEAPAQPVLGLSASATDTLELKMEAHPGLNYLIETSTVFSRWTVLTNLCQTVSLSTNVLPQASDPCRFYRARLR